MTHFYVRACPEGHYEIDIMRARDGQLCRKCGTQLIDSCPECGTLIRELILYGASMMPPRNEEYNLPDICPKC